MKANLHPNTQAMLEKLTPEQCEKILNTEYTTSDIKSQMERLEEIKEQLSKPGEVTIDGYVARNYNGPRDLGLRVYSVKPKRYEKIKEWNGYGRLSYLIDHRLFPSVTWESEPKRVKITITPME